MVDNVQEVIVQWNNVVCWGGGRRTEFSPQVGSFVLKLFFVAIYADSMSDQGDQIGRIFAILGRFLKITVSHILATFFTVRLCIDLNIK
jgi:hypothetical protein